MTDENIGTRIKTQNESTLEADKFISYGFDPKYFAIVGKDLYARTDGKNYELLAKDFHKDMNQTTS